MNESKLRLKAPDGSSYADWEDIPFGDLLEQYSKKTKTNNEDILLSCAIDGIFLNSELFSHQRASDNTGYLKIDKGTLILSAQNLHLGNANVNMRFDHGIISPAYKTFHLKGCLPEFMAHWVKREGAKKFFYNVTTTGASQCRRNVEWETLYEQPIMMPSIEEQKAIANFLALYDQKIANQMAKIEALETRRKGLLQKIFSQEIRFKADDGSDFEDWEETLLSDILTERKEKSTGKEEVYSVSVAKGLVNQIEHLGRSFAAEDTSKYKVICPGDVVYTKSPTGEFKWGIVKQSMIDKSVIVSPLYGIFIPKTEALGFVLDAYFSSSVRAHNYLITQVRKGAKNTINVSNDEFLDNYIMLPTSEDEAKKIKEFVSLLDQQIQVEKDKLEAIKNVKKGLLQQMFV